MRKWRVSMPAFGQVSVNFSEIQMTKPSLFAPPARLAAILGLAGSLLFGCGGGDTGTTSSEQPAAAQITETAAVLSVKTALSADANGTGARSDSSDGQSTSVTHAIQYNFAANVDATTVLQGTLALRGESEDGGAIELRGRLVSATASTMPTAAALADFAARKAELKATLRAAVDAAKAAYDAARLAGSGNAEARSALRVAIAEAVSAYRAALAESATTAGVSPTWRRDGDGERRGRSGASVKGTMEADGQLTLTIKQRNHDPVIATGAGLTLGGDLKGTFSTTLDGVPVVGTWTASPATETDPVVPLPPEPTPTDAPCVAQAVVTWLQGTSTCTAAYAGGASGSSATLSDLLAPTTGTLIASCSNGVLTKLSPECSTAANPIVPSPTPAPVATPCAAQSVTWTVGTSSCSAGYAGGISGSSASLTNTLGTTMGSVTASCSNGAITQVNPVCTTPAPVAVGNVAAGSTKYTSSCSGCHGQGKASDAKVNTAAKLASVMDSVGSHSGLRTSLSEQDRLDIAAYVASPK